MHSRLSWGYRWTENGRINELEVQMKFTNCRLRVHKWVIKVAVQRVKSYHLFFLLGIVISSSRQTRLFDLQPYPTCAFLLPVFPGLTITPTWDGHYLMQHKRPPQTILSLKHLCSPHGDRSPGDSPHSVCTTDSIHATTYINHCFSFLGLFTQLGKNVVINSQNLLIPYRSPEQFQERNNHSLNANKDLRLMGLQTSLLY